ncbi:MAG TPA: hypothetical protein VF032_04395 [Thermoleophilaceae bacterium]
MRSRALAAVVLIAAVAVAFALLTGGGGHSPARAHSSTYSAPDHSFSVSYPAGWKAAPVGTNGGVIERTDHRGVVLVREHAAVRGKLSKVLKDLPAQLAKRFPDFRPVGASVARLSTGPAVVYTFVRTKARKVQTIVVAPTAQRSYTLEVVAPSSAHDAAREAGQIVRSLKAR